MFKSRNKMLMSICIVLFLFAPVWAYSGGTGEPNDPYQIANADDLLELAANTGDYNKCFILIDDVNMAGQVFTKAIIAADTVVGDYSFDGTAFTGTFDGNGRKIMNFTINGGEYIGLFGYIDSGGSVKNLGLENFSVSGFSYVGGLVGSNCGGSINNCYSTGVVSGSWYVGGLVGWSYRGSISDCYATGEVSSSLYYVGGLVGYNYYNSSISNCYSTGSVSGSQTYAGGLVGINYYNSSISNCYATGTVSGSSCVGGLAGRNDYTGSINNCYSTGTVSGSGIAIGGLVGGNGGGSISNCYSTSAVSGSDRVGGLVGSKIGGFITASFWDIETSGQTTSAGGTGKTTAEMQDINTFLNAGWDFFGETANGTEDIWTICDGITYPTFVWQNEQPMADAGADQTVYAWIDGIAEVELDGSASSDEDDCNGLSYHWTWTIDTNTYEEANGVNPIIDLPVGVHTVELVVNDGLVDSEPNYVEINVIAPLKTDLQIMPTVVNRASNIRNIIAVIELPKGIERTDLGGDNFIVFPADSEEGIEAFRQYVLPCWRHRVKVFAFFDKDDLIDLIPDNGRVELQVVGQLKSGQYIFGEDSIRLIGKRRPFWWWRGCKW